MAEEGREHDDEATLSWFRATGDRLADELAPTLGLEDRLLRVTSSTRRQMQTGPSAAAGPATEAHTLRREAQVDAEVRVGIVTSLAVEYAAMQRVLDEGWDLEVKQDPHRYFSASLASKTPGRVHQIVLAQSWNGRRDAAALTTDMLRSFPGLRVVIVCGIASGVPAPGDPGRDVLLGDVVVATGGIVDYDHVRRVDGAADPRGSIAGISPALRRADDTLRARGPAGEAPWHGWMDQAALETASYRRPPTSRKLLGRNARTSGQIELAASVARPGRGGAEADRDGPQLGYPRVWRGVTGSGDVLLRDARLRDEFAARRRILAVEMEGASIAATLEMHGRHWFMVRGVADYGGDAKGDEWHKYAALAAASYVRSLLAECLPFDGAPGDPLVGGAAAPDEVPAGRGLGRLEPIVEALLGLNAFLDSHQRQAVVDLLPGPLRAAVSDNASPRFHAINLVSTCQRTPGGRDALLDALRLAFGASSAEFQTIDAVIRGNWPDH